MVSSGETDKFASDELQIRHYPDNGSHMTQAVDDTGNRMPQNQEVCSVTCEKTLQDPDAGVHIMQLDKEGSISCITSGRVSQTQGTRSSASQSGQEGRNLIEREKVSEDGYHWRKYGQKFVKGNEFIRSYYKCTHPNCQAKKQLERSHDGKISDIVHFGQHHHPKPELNVPLAVGFALSVEEKADEPLSTGTEEDHAPCLIKSSTASPISVGTSREDVKRVLTDSNSIKEEVDDEDDLPSKRQRKGNRSVESTPVDKPSSEPRLVVQTLSEVDIVNDGYRWRKYGQKMVKGNPNPRSYYRCSSSGCPVKKHVERASNDSKVVITSYEGQHDHDMPPSRTITLNTTALNAYTTAANSGESGGSDFVHNSSGPSGNSKEQRNSESRSKSKGSDVRGSDMIIHSDSHGDSKSVKMQNRKSIAKKGSDATVSDTMVNTGSVSEERLDEQQHNGKSRTEPKVNCAAYTVHTITPGPESNPTEQRMPNAEPVQS